MFIITGRFAEFQSALRFAVVSDLEPFFRPFADVPVSIRFKVRGGFRPVWMGGRHRASLQFQSALRFAVVSDLLIDGACSGLEVFQSALRFAGVSDQPTDRHDEMIRNRFNPL